MIHINEYLLGKDKKLNIIYATNENIRQIVKDELDKFGHDADLNHIDVSKVTDMTMLFCCDQYGLGSKYNDLNPDISEWDVSEVKDMWGMFKNCKKFDQDISGWNTMKVEIMYAMFMGCENFNQDLSGWNIQSVKYHDSMFNDCPIEEKFKPKFN